MKENGMMRYEYYPDGDLNAPGVVEFNPNEKPKIIKDSDIDVKRYYAIHAMNNIDTTKESGTVAWC